MAEGRIPAETTDSGTVMSRDATLGRRKRASADAAAAATPSATARGGSARFNQRKQAVLDAASVLINRVGLGDTTLGLVANEISLNLKSLRYYFEKREDLMVAAFLQSIALHRELVARASGERTPEARVRQFVQGYFEMMARVMRGEQPAFTHFSDLRALAEPHSAIVYQEYNQFFRAVRMLLRPRQSVWTRAELNARTHMLVSQLLWSVAWIGDYVSEDYARVADRFTDVLLNGISTSPVDIAPQAASLQGVSVPSGGLLSQESFLRTATALINEQGYRGASVERVAAVLNVSRGAFYHHYEARDELVVACFDRTFDVLRRAQTAGMTGPGSGMQRLATTAVDLVTRQMMVEGFMLRTTALTVVGPEVRRDMAWRMSLATLRFEDMLSDGIADGSARICDLRIAAQMVTAMINSAAELHRWVPGAVPEQVSELYVAPLLYGLFGERAA